MPYQEARPRSTVVLVVEAALVVPGVEACAGALSKVSKRNKLERKDTLKERNKITRFADGEHDKHKVSHPGIAKFQGASANSIGQIIDLF